MFDAEHEAADHRAFAECCEGDRHHFRFIVSPQDAEQLSGLRAFTSGILAPGSIGSESTTGTDNPHIHVIVRGRSDDGRDLVIARDYISQDLRAPPIWRPSSSAPEPISRR
jgi:type IV secretory pathway VirD2 relaxase